jgi:hypothetical protein
MNKKQIPIYEFIIRTLFETIKALIHPLQKSKYKIISKENKLVHSYFKYASDNNKNLLTKSKLGIYI